MIISAPSDACMLTMSLIDVIEIRGNPTFSNALRQAASVPFLSEKTEIERDIKWSNANTDV